MVKKSNRPYKYNSKSRLTSTSSFPFSSSSVKKLNESKKNLENTLTKFRIDDDFSQNKEILDNTFLEGRVDKGRKKDARGIISFWKKVCLAISIICAVVLIVLVSVNTVSRLLVNNGKNKETIIKNDKIDDNYLFVGDYNTMDFPFNDYGLDYHYVKSGRRDLTTADLLNNMKTLIYDYNPSVVFLEVGNVDVREGVNSNDIVNNYIEIVKLIKSNRPNAIICIESLYFNDEYDVSLINDKIKELCNDKDVYYIDVYSILKFNDYNDDYSLNSEGYQKLYERIKSILG